MNREGLIIALLMWVCCGIAATGQTDPMLSHYYEIPAYYNPGAAGRGDMLRVRAVGRAQWVGVDNAPRSLACVADMPVKLSGMPDIAAGIAFHQEKLGLYRNLTAGVMAGLRLKVAGGTVTPALRLGMLGEAFKGSEVILPDSDSETTDDAIPATDVSGNAFDVGIGVGWQKKNFECGLSVLHLNSPTVSFSGAGVTAGSGTGDAERDYYEISVSPTCYLSASGNIPVKNTLLELLPSIIFASDFTSMTGAATILTRYNHLLSIGAGYRWKDALTLHLAVEYRGLYLGYSYEYPLSEISRVSNGSHEIAAGYSIKLDLSDKNRFKQKSIRIL